MKKKFLSTLLALAMCLSLLPTAALADDTPPLAPSAPPSAPLAGTPLTADLLARNHNELRGGGYYLSGNLTITETITVSDNSILNLNGHVLKMDSSIYGGTATGSVIEVSSGKTLTLEDSNPYATHYVYSQSGSDLWRWDESAEGQPQPTNSGGKTYSTFTGGIITGGSSYGGGIKVEPSATLTMNGGNIIGCTSVCGGGVYVGKSVNPDGSDAGGTFVMNGGSIIGCAAGGQGGGVFVYHGSSFTMNGGSIRHCICAQQETEPGAMCYGGGVYSSGSFTMKGGSIEDCDAKLNGSIQDNIGKADGKSIYLANQTLADILPDGYVLKSENTVIGNLSALTVGICDENVTAAACTHKDATNASTIGQNGKCSLCGGTCTHTLGAENKCGNCGKPLIAEVTKTTPSGGTAISYLATTGVTKVELDDVDDFDLIARVFQEESTTKIKLLANVEATWSRAVNFILPNQTLDLNGHTLDTKGSQMWLSQSPTTHSIIPSLTITDSSATKDGKLKAGQVRPSIGTLTINSGTVTVQNSDNNPPILIDGGSMTISGTAMVNCSTITVTGSSDSTARPGSLTVQDNAEITGGITVGDNGTLTMTGGTMKPQQSSPAFMVDVASGGTANISGGVVGLLYADSNSNVSLSGGIYNTAYVRGNGKATALLKDGYAYYDASGSPSTGMTKGDLINVSGTTVCNSTIKNEGEILSTYIMVAPHECTFTADPNLLGTYRCDCGRKATQEPIAYVDENGKTAYCTNYRTIAGSDVDTAQNFWYVVTGDAPFAVDNLNFPQGAHLILKNNTALTVKGLLYAESGKSLSIYGQPAATGQTTGKLTINANEENAEGGIISLGSLTINGGDISVDASVLIDNSLRNDYGIVPGYYSVAVADKLTVNGGSLTVTAPGLTNIGSIGVYGVYADELTVNGGKIKVTGGDITAAGATAQVRPRGICTHKLTMTGGDVSATAAAVEVTCNSTSNSNACESRSYGVYVTSNVTGNGVVASITGGKLTATGGSATIKNYAPGMIAESIGLYVYGEILVDGGTVEATGGNATLSVTLPPDDPNAPLYDPRSISCGLYANTTLKSGTITARRGTATATGYDDAEAEAWDLDCGLTMKGGTVTDGTATGSVLANLDLNMTGGTLKLKENSFLGFAYAPGNADLADLLPEGCAYYEMNYGFATLSGLLQLHFADVRPCTYTAESGTCPYCGKDFGPAAPDPDPEPTPTPPAPGGTYFVPTYTVSAPGTDNGSITVSPRQAAAGTKVTITVAPNSGYTLETLTVLDSSGREIPLTNNGDGTYSFQMPAGQVHIRGTFMEDNSMLNFFVDVPADAYFYDAVLWAVKNGITDGVDESHFDPNGSCTRAQLVTFLWRAAGCPAVNFAVDFTDMADGAYYLEAIRWAASLGIVDGYGNGLFGTGDTITREQMAVILYRFAQAMGMDAPQGGKSIQEFADHSGISDYAREAMQWAVRAGVLQGSDGQLMPDAPCTRAQIVAMLYRLLGE